MEIPPLFDAKGHPSPLLEQLLDLLDIQYEKSFDSILEATQHWLRKTKERWQMRECYPEKKSAAFALLKKMGCIDAIPPKNNMYDQVLVLGQHEERSRQRLAYLLSQWEKGLRFKQLVILTGDRSLDPNTEPAAATCKNETEMMRSLYTSSSLPEAFRLVPLTVIDTPKHKGERPTTADTIVYWLKTHPKPCHILALSSQPFIGYQDAVLKTKLPAPFSIETIGPSAPADTLLAHCLDNLARWIYTIHARKPS